MGDVIFQASDLANDRTRFLSAARAGRALVRDKDGTGLVMLPESELAVLEGYAHWSQRLDRLNRVLRSEREFGVAELEDLAWLRVFDLADVQQFAVELHAALMAGLADEDLAEVESLVRDWRITGRQLEDPLRRSILLGHDGPDEYSDAPDLNGPE